MISVRNGSNCLPVAPRVHLSQNALHWIRVIHAQFSLKGALPSCFEAGHVTVGVFRDPPPWPTWRCCLFQSPRDTRAVLAREPRAGPTKSVHWPFKSCGPANVSALSVGGGRKKILALATSHRLSAGAGHGVSEMASLHIPSNTQPTWAVQSPKRNLQGSLRALAVLSTQLIPRAEMLRVPRIRGRDRSKLTSEPHSEHFM